MAEHDKFITDTEVDHSAKMIRAQHLSHDLSKASDNLEQRYTFDDKFIPGDSSDPMKCKTITDVVRCLTENASVGLDARVLHYNPLAKTLEPRKMSRQSFLETIKRNDVRFREGDPFSNDSGGFGNTGLVGDDFLPILGGPFFKQLYYYDFQRMQAASFWAYHHDPFAKRIVQTIRDFTLGKGYRVDFKDSKHDALWEAFVEANNLDEQFDYFSREISIYGESMWWWLPNNQTEIAIGRRPDEQIRTGVIPRIRLMDPSMFWEIITYPEDITRALAYQWVSPTQYQTYSHVDATNQSMQTSKFIYQQIPAEQIIHCKVNSVSNEKRGRSDLFPVLGYLKRLRDSVNYSILAMQKSAAWSIDTSIEGNSADIANYISEQQSLGTLPPAASEFVHTSKIKREYLSNTATSRGGSSSAFEWCLNMISAGSGIPVSYFGTHLSGGQTRASAIVATEPVAKMFEMRQVVYKRTLDKIIKYFMRTQAISDYQVEITFPEIITQDRSQKLKDLYLAETTKWFSPKRAANMAAQEFSQSDYDWEQEQKDIKAQQAEEPVLPGASPLTQPGLQQNSTATVKPSAVPGTEKAAIKRNDNYANS